MAQDLNSGLLRTNPASGQSVRDYNSGPLTGTAQGVGLGGGFSPPFPPNFLAVDVRPLNVQLDFFKVLMKDGEFTCFDEIKQLSEAEKCMITGFITLCKLLLVNPAISAAD